MTKIADVLAECHPIRNIFMYSHNFFLASIPPNYTIFGNFHTSSNFVREERARSARDDRLCGEKARNVLF